MRSTLFAILYFLFLSTTLGQVKMDYYLSEDWIFDKNIPNPESFLGYVPGTWHVGHDPLYYYMKALASQSDRVAIEHYAKSHEGRNLIHLIITDPKNHENIDAILEERKKVKSGIQQNLPLVVQMGYSVHGNEASGSNAALLVAYVLAASQNAWIQKILEEVVIVLDPSYNPDGLNRFASWVNTHKSSTVNSDPNDREYHEVWPRGRTNHYWFDLNRDWLPLQHPESKGRIKQFHRWMPHILTDHHEMGTHNTFFFQPGIPSRNFPNTDKENYDLTQEMATYHAAILDSIGSLYYTKESFDDFYIGKGSTYPDINGSIGILFEQASARGHAQETPYGTMTFPFAIKNQFVTSLSTLKAAFSLKNKLQAYQSNQYASYKKWNTPSGYIFGDDNDPMKTNELVEILQTHDITLHNIEKEWSQSGIRYRPQHAYVVSMNQPQARLITSIFEKRTKYKDSLFYDVSTWTLPLAFDIPYHEVGAKTLENILGSEVLTPLKSGSLPAPSNYAYAFETHGYFSHRALQRLLKEDIIVRVSHKQHQSSSLSLSRGAIIIPLGVQKEKKEKIEALLSTIVEKDGITVFPLPTGLATGGVDLGSPSMSVVSAPTIAVLVGEGINPYEVGEIWHVLDKRLQTKITKLPVENLSKTDLSQYNRLIFPDGNYKTLDPKTSKKLSYWVANGGVIIAWKGGGKWLSDMKISNVKFKKSEKDTLGYENYENYNAKQGAKYTGGSIFEASIDVSHPIAYGFTRAKMPLFRNHNLILEKSPNPFAHPIVYTPTPLISGYIHPANEKRIAQSPAIQISAKGKGRIITLADNPNFRAFWWGTNKLFFNALYFGDLIQKGTTH